MVLFHFIKMLAINEPFKMTNLWFFWSKKVSWFDKTFLILHERGISKIGKIGLVWPESSKKVFKLFEYEMTFSTDVSFLWVNAILKMVWTCLSSLLLGTLYPIQYYIAHVIELHIIFWTVFSVKITWITFDHLIRFNVILLQVVLILYFEFYFEHDGSTIL